MRNLLDYLPGIPDFPKPGVLFRDIGPLLADPAAFEQALQAMEAAVADWQFDLLAGIESRGLIFASALATRMHRGLVLVRKPGKLPPVTATHRYQLEYGEDALEIQPQRLPPGTRILLVDDVIATGGTLLAAAHLIRNNGGSVAGVVALLALDFLGGSERLRAADLSVAAALRL